MTDSRLTRDKIIARGLDDIMMMEDLTNLALKERLLSEYPELLREHLSELDPLVQKEFLGEIFKNNPSELLEPFWINYIDESLKLEGFLELPAFLLSNSSWFIMLNRALDLRSDSRVDWHNILEQLSDVSSEFGRMASDIYLVIDWLSEVDENFLLTFANRSKTSKMPRSFKLDLYCRLVRSGNIDIKVARKVRSDTSGELSVKVLACIFQNRRLYSDSYFETIISQFTDTKHSHVARYLAYNLPLDMTPFIMGIKDQKALDIIEKRLNSEG